jgi:hypothetical protein
LEPFAKFDPFGHKVDAGSGSRLIADVDGCETFVVPGDAAIKGKIEPDVFAGTRIVQIERVAPIAFELNGGVKLIEKWDVAYAAQAFEGCVPVDIEDNLEGALWEIFEVVGVCEQ